MSETKTVPTPALGFSIAANIGGTMQLTLQAFFDRDIDPKEGHRLIDAAMAYAKRQEAIALLPGLQDELLKLETTLKRFEADKTRLDSEHEALIEAKKKDAATLVAAAERAGKRAYDDFATSGRQGEFELKGSAKAEVGRLSQGADVIKAEIQKIEAEREVALSQLVGSIARYGEDSAKHQRWIAEKEALINLE